MKIVREHIFEEFVEDSDPIKDMGIGILIKRTFNSGKELGKFLYDNMKALTEYYGFKYDGRIISRIHKHTFINLPYRNVIDFYVDEFVKDFRENTGMFSFNSKYVGYVGHFIAFAQENK